MRQSTPTLSDDDKHAVGIGSARVGLRIGHQDQGPAVFLRWGQRRRQTSFDDWHLQKLNKMEANEVYMGTDFLKKAYVKNLVRGNALARLKLRILPDTTNP